MAIQSIPVNPERHTIPSWTDITLSTPSAIPTPDINSDWGTVTYRAVHLGRPLVNEVDPIYESVHIQVLPDRDLPLFDIPKGCTVVVLDVDGKHRIITGGARFDLPMVVHPEGVQEVNTLRILKEAFPGAESYHLIRRTPSMERKGYFAIFSEDRPPPNRPHKYDFDFNFAPSEESCPK